MNEYNWTESTTKRIHYVKELLLDERHLAKSMLRSQVEYLLLSLEAYQILSIGCKEHPEFRSGVNYTQRVHVCQTCFTLIDITGALQIDNFKSLKQLIHEYDRSLSPG
jgi:hypothetical protein